MICLADTRNRARRLKLMAFDVDGVLSEGSLYYTDDGVELKVFNSLDGLGMHMLQRAGITVAIITGRRATCVEHRMKNLGIDILYQGVADKVEALNDLLAKRYELAQLLGYKNWAAYITEDKMIKNPEAAQAFIDLLRSDASTS